MKSKVSIIIPAFNEEKFLPLCLDSISRLNWPKDRFEIIVIDNGSTDNTCRIAESYHAVVLKDPAKNVSGLRNLGAMNAGGDILAFVDADCIVSEDWLMEAEKYFNKKQYVAWGSPPGIPHNATWVQKAWYIVRQKETAVEKVDWLESMNLFVRKHEFLQINGFDESLVTCEDVDFSYRITQFGLIVSDPSIKAQHLGEADTVRVFIKKEIWRGRGNIKGAFKHGIKLKEIPSLAIPAYFAFFLPVLVLITLWASNLFMGFLVLLAAVFPGVLILFKVRHKKAGIFEKIQLLFLSYLYFFARTVAVFRH